MENKIKFWEMRFLKQPLTAVQFHILKSLTSKIFKLALIRHWTHPLSFGIKVQTNKSHTYASAHVHCTIAANTVECRPIIYGLTSTLLSNESSKELRMICVYSTHSEKEVETVWKKNHFERWTQVVSIVRCINISRWYRLFETPMFAVHTEWDCICFVIAN